MKQTGDPTWDAPEPKRPKRSSQSTEAITAIYETNLPPSIWPFEKPATMKIEVAGGKGEEWLQEAFPDVCYDVTDARSSK